MNVHLENVDFVLLGFTLFSALLIGGFIIYIWISDQEK
tara:strand:- start:580 stop:693 length:114 start_codon:yes stop_codon:yes gene_type:complete